MSSVEARLTTCFLLALPGLRETGVSQASTATVPAWESLTTVNLLSLVEEEFNIAVPAEEVKEFVSFERVLNVVRRHCDAAGDH
jgi:acyl carrier protein